MNIKIENVTVRDGLLSAEVLMTDVMITEYVKTGKTIVTTYSGGSVGHNPQTKTVETFHDAGALLTIDLNKIAAMLAPTAIRSKGGRSVEASGAIAAVRRRRVEMSRKVTEPRALEENEHLEG